MNNECSSYTKKSSSIQNGKLKILETILFQWFREMTAPNLPISGIQRKSIHSVINGGNRKLFSMRMAGKNYGKICLKKSLSE